MQEPLIPYDVLVSVCETLEIVGYDLMYISYDYFAQVINKNNLTLSCVSIFYEDSSMGSVRFDFATVTGPFRSFSVTYENGVSTRVDHTDRRNSFVCKSAHDASKRFIKELQREVKELQREERNWISDLSNITARAHADKVQTHDDFVRFVVSVTCKNLTLCKSGKPDVVLYAIEVPGVDVTYLVRFPSSEQ